MYWHDLKINNNKLIYIIEHKMDVVNLITGVFFILSYLQKILFYILKYLMLIYYQEMIIYQEDN